MTVDNGELSGFAELEALERSRPGSLTEEDYAKLMLGYLHNRFMMDVKFLSKRLPDGLKEKNFAHANLLMNSATGPESIAPLIASVKNRVQLFSLEHIRRVYSTISLDRFATIVGQSQDIPALISQITELGLEFDPDSKLISVGPLALEAEAGEYRVTYKGPEPQWEPNIWRNAGIFQSPVLVMCPEVSRGGLKWSSFLERWVGLVLEDETWSPDLDSLEQISETVWALGKTPVIIGDNVKTSD